MKAKIGEIICLGGALPLEELIGKINAAVAGWVQYFRVGNANRAFSEVRDYLEMKVRTLLRMNLFTHRDLWTWLDKPFGTLPIQYEPDPLAFSLRSILDTIRKQLDF